MVWSHRRTIGLIGFLALYATVQGGAALRHRNGVWLGDPVTWLWALLPVVMMGSWGWIVLYWAGQLGTLLANRLLAGLAIVYFAIATVITFNVVTEGNSTAGLAFFFFPGVAAFPMLPLMILFVWLGTKFGKEA